MYILECTNYSWLALAAGPQHIFPLLKLMKSKESTKEEKCKHEMAISSKLTGIIEDGGTMDSMVALYLTRDRP